MAQALLTSQPWLSHPIIAEPSCLLAYARPTPSLQVHLSSTTVDAELPSSHSSQIGWEAREPGASLSLCTPFPTDDTLVASEPTGGGRAASTRVVAQHDQQSKPSWPYQIAVGLQLSHDLNLPLFGVAKLRCEGACICVCSWSHHGAFNASCQFDGLAKERVTVTAFARLAVARRPPDGRERADATGCPSDQCAVRITNTDAESGERSRVIVRALIVGFSHHYATKWLNTHSLDVSGMTYIRARRQRS